MGLKENNLDIMMLSESKFYFIAMQLFKMEDVSGHVWVEWFNTKPGKKTKNKAIT
jgi:hypothetical protein